MDIKIISDYGISKYNDIKIYKSILKQSEYVGKSSIELHYFVEKTPYLLVDFISIAFRTCEEAERIYDIIDVMDFCGNTGTVKIDIRSNND